MELDHPQSQNDLKHWTFGDVSWIFQELLPSLLDGTHQKNHWKFSPFKPFMAVRKFSLVTPSRISWAPGKSTQPFGIWELMHCGCNGWLGFHIMVDCKWCPENHGFLRISKKQTYSQCENSQVSMEFRWVSSQQLLVWQANRLRISSLESSQGKLMKDPTNFHSTKITWSFCHEIHHHARRVSKMNSYCVLVLG